jgi:hypothetical protein
MRLRYVKVEDLRWAVEQLTTKPPKKVSYKDAQHQLMHEFLQDIHAALYDGREWTDEDRARFTDRLADILTVVNCELPS